MSTPNDPTYITSRSYSPPYSNIINSTLPSTSSPYSNITNSNITKSSKLYVFEDDYAKYTSRSNHPIDTKVVESNNILNREYTLLFIWFIIAIIFIIITTFGILTNELNNFILYPTLGFFIFIMFYIFKNIYIYFNGLN